MSGDDRETTGSRVSTAYEGVGDGIWRVGGLSKPVVVEVANCDVDSL